MFYPDDRDMWDPWVLAFQLDRSEVVSRDDFGLVDQGRDCQRTGDLVRAQSLYQQAIEWAAHARTPDARRVQAEGLIYLGDLTRARDVQASKQYYDRARSLFEALSSHNLGVAAHRLATWYEENARYTDAWREYTATLTLWRELAREHGRLGNRLRYARYQEDIRQLVEHIRAVLARAGQPDAGQIDDHEAEPPPAAAPIVPAAPAAPERDRLRDLDIEVDVIPVYDDLAAGSGLWIGDDDNVRSFGRMDSLLIDGTRYQFIKLLGDGMLTRLSLAYFYGLARVQGKSMDRAGIEDNDFVLFRKLRDVPFHPNNGDIVAAAVIRNGMREGVVKRYCEEPSGLSLVPESTEYHEPIPLDNVEVDWIGQVIAVVKPIV